MIYPGLASVTFRNLKAPEIISLAEQARLYAIEWGGDLHVPAGKLSVAKEVSEWMYNSGISACSYGSYYEVCASEKEGIGIEQVIDTALELHTNNIRIWAGNIGSDKASNDHRKKIVGESRRIAEIGKKNGMTFSFEYHGGTLTDSLESALCLIREINCDNVKLYWQPITGMRHGDNLNELRALSPWLSNIHVFHWGPTICDRHLLEEGRDQWQDYFELVFRTDRDHFAFLEFAKNDSAENFLKDAQTLTGILENISNKGQFDENKTV